jgi:hypothetical protein
MNFTWIFIKVPYGGQTTKSVLFFTDQMGVTSMHFPLYVHVYSNTAHHVRWRGSITSLRTISTKFYRQILFAESI